MFLSGCPGSSLLGALVAASGGCSSGDAPASQRRARAPGRAGFSGCGSWRQRTGARVVAHGIVAPQLVESSQATGQTQVSCISKPIPSR